MRQRIIIIFIAIILAIGAVVLFLRSRDNSRNDNDIAIDNPAELQKSLSETKSAEEKQDFLAARDIYKKLITDFPESTNIVNWQKKLEDFNLKLLFSNRIIPGSISYEVQPGDSLAKIASKNHTTVDLIKKCNNLSEDRIFAGQKLKVWTLPFNILVDKSQNILLLKINDDVFKTYRVSTGANNCSPVGTFKIKNKIVKPVWYNPQPILPEDPRNILGTRWMGFDTASRYGIHCTTDPVSIGTQATQGCVRMLNNEVEELFIIIPEGTEVTIID